MQTNAAIANQRALEVGFAAYGEDLERVEVFKYLGRLMTMDDTDTQAIRDNLCKARKVWKMLHRLLRGENMTPRVCGMFFKAVVQAVLLYGSETWAVTDSAMRCLEGFYYRAACRMARKTKAPTQESHQALHFWEKLRPFTFTIGLSRRARWPVQPTLSLSNK